MAYGHSGNSGIVAHALCHDGIVDEIVHGIVEGIVDGIVDELSITLWHSAGLLLRIVDRHSSHNCGILSYILAMLFISYFFVLLFFV